MTTLIRTAATATILALASGLAWADPPPVPRYYTYQPPAGVGNGAGEPAMGFNLATNRSLFIAGLRTLRLTYPDRPADLATAGPAAGDALWEDVSTLTTTLRTLDPVLHTNRATGRTFISQTTAGTGTQFLYAYTDDDGATWETISKGLPNGGVDHQTIGSGPYPATLPPGANPTWPATGPKQAVYYCSQDIVNAAPHWCSRSDDGGQTWNPGIPTVPNQCISSHGHVKVGPDGTVYLPTKGCGGVHGMHVSRDAGVTWTVSQLPGATPDGQIDASVGVADDNTLYYCFVTSNKRVRARVSRDRGATWSNDRDLGASVGVVQAVFPEAVAGDGNRAACAFLGTNNGGDRTPATFQGVWYPYIATTYDGGETWTTVNLTPGDAVQGIGGLCTAGTTCGGTNRNLLDFNYLTIDDKGYALFSYADGCTGACAKNPAFNGFTAKATVTRQVGGWPLYAAHDVAEPRLPDRPFLEGVRTIERTTLKWRAPEDGGASIDRYYVFRGTSEANLQKISSITGTTFEDITTDPSVEAYVYKVAAVNSSGQGLPSNAITLPVVPKPPEESSCALPGITAALDPVADSANGGTNPPMTDFTKISAAELPSDPDKIVFTLKVESLFPTAPPDGYWVVLYQGNRYFAMLTVPPTTATGQPVQPDALLPGPVWFRKGTYAAGTAGVLTFTDTGPLEATGKKSNYQTDGTIQLYAPRAIFGNGNPPRGYVITPIDVRSRLGHFTVPSLDTAGPGDYEIRGTDICLAQTPPVAHLVADVIESAPGATINFDAGGSYDLDQGAGTANDTIASYIFDFGDSSEELIQATPHAAHAYPELGAYPVRLRVTDSRGQISANTAEVIVQVKPADLLPDAFTFLDRANVATNVFVTSEARTITGINAPAPVSVVNGQYSIDGGPYTSAAGTIARGQALRVRHVSASAPGVTVATAVTVGEYSTEFRSTTTTADRTPDAFGFTAQSGVPLATAVESNVITPAGFNTPVTVVAGPGSQYRINGGAWTAADGTLHPGDTVQTKHTSAATPLTYTKSWLKLGGVTGYFTTRTQ